MYPDEIINESSTADSVTGDVATADTQPELTNAATSDPAIEKSRAAIDTATAEMNNATFDKALPSNQRNLATAHTAIVRLSRALLIHAPDAIRQDAETLVNIFEEIVKP